MHVIERVLVQQVDVLETMTPQDFLEFRQRLAPASGFQSVQFRELEFMSGAKDPSYLSRFKGITDAERQHLDARLAEPTLWDAFIAVLRSFDLAADSDEEISASMRTVAHDRDQYAVVWALAEALLQHDELAANWRARHVVMVERMIGSKSGTGGSSGSTYLRSRLPVRYYPLLWDLRSELLTPGPSLSRRPQSVQLASRSRQRSTTSTTSRATRLVSNRPGELRSGGVNDDA